MSHSLKESTKFFQPKKDLRTVIGLEKKRKKMFILPKQAAKSSTTYVFRLKKVTSSL